LFIKNIIATLLLLVGAWNNSGDQQKTIAIGIVTDVQYCDRADNGARHYRASLSKLEECIKYFNKSKPDFIVHLGDIIDHGFSSYDSVLTRFNKSTVPVNYVIGNHDYDVNLSSKLKVLKKLELEKPYYKKTIGDWEFIFLNGDELNIFYPRNKTLKKETRKVFTEAVKKGKSNFFPWNSGIGSVQLAWIKTELDKAARSGKKVIIMCHFPIYPFEFYNLRNDEELLSIISQYKCVKAYLCGHNHEGGYGFKDGIHFINFKGMVETGNNTAFAELTLTSDSIFVEGQGIEPNRRLKIY
jgi:manganese-dependent ADP-ribose/CDP-alcohol diphosphatase